MSAPTVTVIVPVHDRTEYLDAALDSIAAQDYGGAVEVLVIDDGSVEPVAPRFASRHPQVRFIRQPNAGLARVRQVGAEAASTDLITFLDDDDLLPVGSLARRVQFLLAHPEVGVVAGDIAHFGPGRPLGGGYYHERFPRLHDVPHAQSPTDPAGRVYPQGGLVNFLLLNMPFCAVTTLTWRRWFFDIGGWGGEETLLAETYDFCYRATLAGRFGYLDTPVAHVRRGHQQITADLLQGRRRETQELAAWGRTLGALDRRRVVPRLARRFLSHGLTQVRHGHLGLGTAMGLAGVRMLMCDPMGFAERPWRTGQARPALS